MSVKQGHTTETDRSDDGDLIELVADPADLENLAISSSVTESVVDPGSETLILSLEDLLPDAEGEVVVLSEDNVPLSLVTDETLAGSGIVDHHVTASGLDVEGLYYYSFSNGVTLYSESDIVIVADAVGG